MVVVVLVCTVVSFFKESGVIELVSFLSESITLVLLVLSELTESTFADPLPLQATIDPVMAKASKLFFTVVFIIAQLF